MPRWFLPYHSPDEALAERLKVALERKDPEARVFFAPEHLRAGGFWQRALAEEIAVADAFILLVAGHEVGNWQELEYFAALDRRATSNFPLVLMLLEGKTAPGLPFLRQLHWIVSADPTSEKDLGRLSGACGAGQHSWRFVAVHIALSRPCRYGGKGQRLFLRA